MEGAWRQPAPALRPYIDGYRGYWHDGITPGVHRGLPSRHVTLLLSLAAPIDITAMPHPGRPGAFQAFVAGLHATPATVVRDRHEAGIHLDVTALGARALLGVPAAALASHVVHLEDLLGPLATELLDRVRAAPTWAARFAVLDDVLSRSVSDAPAPAAEVAWAWQRVVATGGTIEVGALADEVGWSRRHLGERFRAELGLSPKVAARVVRFERARRMLQQPGVTRLADVAAACGYYDQAHLTRDFGEMAGCSPLTWMAEELPSVQDEDLSAQAS
jgi:AraC-like DNA-binding protein